MADIVETSERSVPLPAELFGDEVAQQCEVLIPKSNHVVQGSTPTAGASRATLGWMFSEDSSTRPSVRPPEMSKAPQFQQLFERDRAQVSGTKFSRTDQGGWIPAAEFAKQEMSPFRESKIHGNLDPADIHKGPESSDEFLGYSKQGEMEEEIITLLRAQLAEQRKLVAISKGQNEILATVSKQLHDMQGMIRNIYRTGLVQNEVLDVMSKTLEDVADATYALSPDGDHKKSTPTQAEMEAEARRLDFERQSHDEIPTLAPGENFDAEALMPAAPAKLVLNASGFGEKSKYA